MKTVIVVKPPRSGPGAGARFAAPTADAFIRCFTARGWRVVTTTDLIEKPADLIAGYGWRPPMRTAWERWPERVLHTDLAWWGRDRYLKLALGGRWSRLSYREYDDRRLRRFGVEIQPARRPGKRVLVAGMSEKHGGTIGLGPEEWERKTVRRLALAGAVVTYRAKPSWRGAKAIPGSTFDRSPTIEEALAKVDAVVTHHSNAAVDALAAGLPIYAETSMAEHLSVGSLEEVVGATAASLEARTLFLRQLAWHQWTAAELAAGTWLEPPAPLSGHQRLI